MWYSNQHQFSVRNTDKNSLWEYFPLRGFSIPTRGTQEGVIIRFRTFYLKIYDDEKTDAYRVQGFRYHEQTPVFEEMVPMVRFREFANRFTRDEYLIEWMQPCDDPHCVIRGNNLIRRYPAY